MNRVTGPRRGPGDGLARSVRRQPRHGEGDLLATAYDALAHWTEVQREADAARAEYHQAIHDLSRAGATPFEIANALCVDIQDVMDIVPPDVPADQRTRLLPTVPTCQFCAAPTSVTRLLIAGPQVRICTGCALLGRQMIADGDTGDVGGVGVSPLRFVPFTSDLCCSFCGARASVVGALLTGGGAQICNHCVETSLMIATGSGEPRR